MSIQNNICYQSLPVRDRILYLLYNHQNTLSYPELFPFFQIEALELQNTLKTLEMEHIITHNNNQYTIIQHQTDPLLRVLGLISTSKFPLTKTDVRMTIKHKQLNIIIDNLLRSRILYEYRAKLSKKVYLIFSCQSDTMICQIESNLIENLTKSTDIADQSHLIMLQTHQNILDHQSDTTDIVPSFTLTLPEQKLMIYLYQDTIRNMQYMTRSVGKNEIEIAHTIFDDKINKTRKTILSLIKKQVLRCSYRHKYYINDHPSVIFKIKQITENTNQKEKKKN